MNLYQTIIPLQSYLQGKRGENIRLGFVPTMGALHEGHLSLIRAAKDKCDIVACSIFVNPTQFNNIRDLELYARPIENDIKLLVQNGCDILFHPKVEEMYGSGLHKDNAANFGHFINLLEGAHRPGHFDGVITIVKQLFEIIQPNEVFFGQKDYQQCLVIKTLIKKNFKSIVFNQCPVIREADGLAMSSRNNQLNHEEREAAVFLYKALMHLKLNWKPDTWQKASEEARELLQHHKLIKLEYLMVCNPETLMETNIFEPNAIGLVAAYIGNTRLIDNLFL